MIGSVILASGYLFNAASGDLTMTCRETRVGIEKIL